MYGNLLMTHITRMIRLGTIKQLIDALVFCGRCMDSAQKGPVRGNILFKIIIHSKYLYVCVIDRAHSGTHGNCPCDCNEFKECVSIRNLWFSSIITNLAGSED